MSGEVLFEASAVLKDQSIGSVAAPAQDSSRAVDLRDQPGSLRCAPRQQVAQVEVAVAEAAPVQRLDERVLGRAHVILDRLLSPITDDLLNIARELSTELLMTMPLPNGTLRLGEDIPAAPGMGLWPIDLERLENDELVAVMRQYGAYDARELGLGTRDRFEGWLNRTLVWLANVTPVAQGTAAKDWAQLSQRMRFIFEYFRSRQQDAALFAAPFSAVQEASIRDRRLPDFIVE